MVIRRGPSISRRRGGSVGGGSRGCGLVGWNRRRARGAHVGRGGHRLEASAGWAGVGAALESRRRLRIGAVERNQAQDNERQYSGEIGMARALLVFFQIFPFTVKTKVLDECRGHPKTVHLRVRKKLEMGPKKRQAITGTPRGPFIILEFFRLGHQGPGSSQRPTITAFPTHISSQEPLPLSVRERELM